MTHGYKPHKQRQTATEKPAAAIKTREQKHDRLLNPDPICREDLRGDGRAEKTGCFVLAWPEGTALTRGGASPFAISAKESIPVEELIEDAPLGRFANSGRWTGAPHRDRVRSLSVRLFGLEAS